MLQHMNVTAALNNGTQATGIEDYPEWWYILEKFTCGVTFAVGCPANLIIIYLVCRLRSLKNATFYLIASLAVADFLVLVMMIFYVIQTTFIRISMPKKLSTYLYPSFDMFLGSASMVNVACVSVDRAIAVAFPLIYDKWVTPEKSKSVIVSVWAYSVLVFVGSLLRMVTDNYTYGRGLLYMCFGLSYFVPITLILTSYVAIIFCAVRNLKFTKSWERAMSNTRQRYNGDASSDNRKRNRRKLLRELKITANILVLVVPFTLGWTFFIGAQIYEESKGRYYYIQDPAINLLIEVTPWLISGLNPILYFLLTRSIRQGCFNHFRKKLFKHAYNLNDSKTSTAVLFSRRAQSAILRRLSGDGGLAHGRRRNKTIRDPPELSPSSQHLDAFDGFEEQTASQV